MADDIDKQKHALRSTMRKARREYAASLDDTTRALLLQRPPVPVMGMIPQGATIGLYYETAGEAPARAYARFLHEQGHIIALPAYDSPDAPMHFREWTDPFGERDLEKGAFGPQPLAENGRIEPDVLFVPLVAFTDRGERMGQGGGFYDRWLAAHPDTSAIGLAWDIQLVEDLPVEAHDAPLMAIVTPTRLYGPFN